MPIQEWNTRRCWDCCSDYSEAETRFAVLRQTMDAPDELIQKMNDTPDEVEARFARAMLFNPVLVCRDCAGWYGDHALGFTPAEVLGL